MDYPSKDQFNGNPKKPNEISVPGKTPETIPAEEPEPGVWPKKRIGNSNWERAANRISYGSARDTPTT